MCLPFPGAKRASDHASSPVHIQARCSEYGMGIGIPEWEIAHGPPGDWVGDRAELHKAEPHCSTSLSRSKVASGVATASRPRVLGIATGLGGIGVARHSRAAADPPASETRVRSAGFAQREETLGESGVDVDDTAGVAHWGNTSSCWARCMGSAAAAAAAAAASETERCTAERPSWWPRTPGWVWARQEFPSSSAGVN